MPELSSFQYNIVYNLMSLAVAGMGAAALFEVVVHDHLIIGNGRQFSFRREGLLSRR